LAETLTQPSLNRALLARQGLLEPFDGPVEQVVEAIGAIQAQYWPAAPVALWSRMRDFDSEALYGALADGRLVTGPLLRGTLHLVSAAHHPAYAALVESERVGQPWRLPGEADALLAELLDFARAEARSGTELVAFVEDWLALNPGALREEEIARQRTYRWRPLLRWSALVRTPADGRWSARSPAALRAAPAPPAEWPEPDAALADVIRRHLGAYGPASPEDVAGWVGWKIRPVRELFGRMKPELVEFQDEAGRRLYDLPNGRRPDPETPAPIRLLPWFDSVLLAYAPKHRARILPDAFKDRVYVAANLQWLPSFLIGGLVAGTWSVAGGRREATLTLVPFTTLDRTTSKQLAEEADRLLRFTHPSALAHRVVGAG
jgi:hypothetical protein